MCEALLSADLQQKIQVQIFSTISICHILTEQAVFNSFTSYLLTYSMVQSPSWEANWFAASQEIPRISRNPKVHYCTHKPPPSVPILGQPNLVHIPTSHLLEIHSNIIHTSTPRSPQWSLSLRFPHQDPICPNLCICQNTSQNIKLYFFHLHHSVLFAENLYCLFNIHSFNRHGNPHDEETILINIHNHNPLFTRESFVIVNMYKYCVFLRWLGSSITQICKKRCNKCIWHQGAEST